MVLAVLSISVLGLIRRVLAPGRVDYDPLLLLPLALVALAALNQPAKVSRRRALAPRTRARSAPDAVDAALFSLVVITFASVLVNDVSAAALYVAASQAGAWLVILLLRHGRLPDVWIATQQHRAPAGYRARGLRPLAVLRAFEWDRRWMIASALTTVGSPEPLAVRVFGASEAPGPFAVLLGSLPDLQYDPDHFGSLDASSAVRGKRPCRRYGRHGVLDRCASRRAGTACRSHLSRRTSSEHRPHCRCCGGDSPPRCCGSGRHRTSC